MIKLNTTNALVVVDKTVKHYDKFIGTEKEFIYEGKTVKGVLIDVYNTEFEMLRWHNFLCELSTGSSARDVCKELANKYKDLTPSTRIGFYLYKICN